MSKLKASKRAGGLILALAAAFIALPAVAQPAVERPGVVVDVLPESVGFNYEGEGASFFRVEMFDRNKERLFDSGLSEGASFDWDLALESGERATPGTYFYVVNVWNRDGDPIRSQVGKVAVAPLEMERDELAELGAGSEPDKLSVTLPGFNQGGDFSIFGKLGVGTPSPVRAVDVEGSNAVFRLRRNQNSAAFLISRTSPGFSQDWKTYIVGVDASSRGNGTFVINDLGTAASGAGNRRMTISNEGRFGLNLTSPSAALDVSGDGSTDLFVLRSGSASVFRVDRDGDVFADGAYSCGLSSGCFNAGQGADVAERIDASSKLEPGDVVEIDPDGSAHFRRSASASSRRVVGVVSTAPAITLGNRFDAVDDGWQDDRPLLALSGRVPVKATAEENGAIGVGDLLISAQRPGFAMRCSQPDYCVGAVIGKALEPLSSGEGLIEIQVMLR